MNEQRKAGFDWMVYGAILFAAIAFLMQWLHGKDIHVPGLGLACGIPGALIMAGLIKLATGVPVWQAAERWGAMPSWKQSLFGLLLILAGVGLIGAVIAVYVHYLI